MKKIISIALSVIIALSVSAAAFAGYDESAGNIPPVIHIGGFGEEIYLNPESEDRIQLFPPTNTALLSAAPDLVKAVLAAAAARDFDAFGKYGMAAMEKLLEQIACRPDGASKENVGIIPRSPSAEDARIETDPDSDDVCFDFTNEYAFRYDWRLDPADNAKGLKDLVEAVKASTGEDKVVFLCHSQGNIIATSYLRLYGDRDVKKLIFLSPAYKGLSLVGALLTKELSVADKGRNLAKFLEGALGRDVAKAGLASAVVSLLDDLGIVEPALGLLQRALEDQIDRIYDECLVDLMGTMPGVWSFVPDENYKKARQTCLNDPKYAGLVEKTDYYHYEIQNKTEKLLAKAKADGASIVISLGYNISTIPVTARAEAHSDSLIDSRYMSLGATFSEFGKTLGDDYEQAENPDGYNYISSDGIIDASTCAFPQNTWFFRGNEHNDFQPSYLEFIEWAVLFDGAPTVRSDKKYPQFAEITRDGIVPVTGPVPEETRGSLRIIIESSALLIKEELEKIHLR